MADLTSINQVKRYFVDAQGIEAEFERLVTAEKLTIDVLHIYGHGGLGKSTLMSICQSFCQAQFFPSALVKGDDVKDPVGLLDKFVKRFKESGLNFPLFEKKFREYREIQAKVTAIEAKNRTDSSEILKIATSAAGAVVKGVAPIPQAPVDLAVKTISDVIDALRKAISKEDVDLYIDAPERLSECFRDDLGRHVKKRRSVIFLDTYEQLSTLDDWICKWAAALPDNFLVVIAGRNPLKMDGWFAAGQTKRIRSVELREMPRGKIEILLQRYYTTAGAKKPDENRIKEIIELANGSPLKAIFAAQTGTAYSAVEEAYRRIRRGTSKDISEALDAVSVVRWFNKELLRKLMDPGAAERIYDELVALHAVRPLSQGPSLHETIAEDTRTYLSRNDPKKLADFQQAALKFHEDRLASMKDGGPPSEEMQSTILEVLYQRFQLEQRKWIRYFRPIFDQCFLGTRDFTFCGRLINDTRTYVHQPEIELWFDFYDASIGMLGSESKAKSRQRLEELQKIQNLDPDLRIEVLERLATSGWYDSLSDAEATDRAERIYDSLYNLHAARDNGIGCAKAQIWLGILRQRTKGGGVPHFRKALSILRPTDQGHTELIAKAKHEFGIALRMRGDFGESAINFRESEEAYSSLGLRFERAHSLFNQGFLRIWLGDLLEANRLLDISIDIFQSAGHARTIEKAWPLIGLSRVALERNQYSKAFECCEEAARVWDSDLFGQSVCGATQAEVLMGTGDFDRAMKLLDNTEASITSSRDMFLSAWALRTRGYSFLGRRRPEEALSCFQSGWRIIKEYESRFGEAEMALGVCHSCLALRKFEDFERAAAQVQHLAEGQDRYLAVLASLNVLRGLACLTADSAIDNAAQASRFITDGLLLAVQFNIFTLDKLLAYVLVECPRQNYSIPKVSALWREATIAEAGAIAYELERRKSEDVDGTHRRTLLDRLG